MNVKTEFVNTEKFKMKYFTFGNGAKTAVIIPGLSMKGVSEAAEGVAPKYKAMANEYTVYFFDRRLDCGEGYTIEDMADDTIAALDILGVKNAYVFGVSQGGMIAQYIALKRHDLVKKLVLGSTTSRITDKNNGVIENWIRLAEERNLDELLDKFVSSVYSKEFSEKYGAFIKQMLIETSDIELDRFIIYAKACRGFDVFDELDKIACPVFVIGVRNDQIFGVETSVEIAEKTNAKLYIYENYGHAVYDEAPDALERIMCFFDE